jgi:hypothetical protein
MGRGVGAAAWSGGGGGEGRERTERDWRISVDFSLSPLRALLLIAVLFLPAGLPSDFTFFQELVIDFLADKTLIRFLQALTFFP